MKVFLDQQISSFFFSKIFQNKKCQTWYKQLENEGIWALYRGFSLFFVSEHFHLRQTHWMYNPNIFGNNVYLHRIDMFVQNSLKY